MLVDIRNVPAELMTAENLGGKGFGLAWMHSQGVNVPPALVIPTSVCVEYMTKPKTVMSAIKKQLPLIRTHFNEVLGYMPLLSVRSGARVSMPGMMDTILNVGLDEKTRPFWAEKIGAACTFDSNQRLITMYGSVVHGIEFPESDPLATINVDAKLKQFKDLTGKDFPDTNGQILGAIEAVFKSWNNKRAKTYRKLHDIPDSWGTACVLQAMVFGNMGEDSCTGVLFSRNPDTGENVVTGEWLPNAQGEDVVDGSHTPRPLAEMAEWNAEVHAQLIDTARKLEEARGDVQDIEFTVQKGQLYILQTRNAKRSAVSALRIAMDMHPGEACLSKISYQQFIAAQQDQLDPQFKGKPIGTGLGACSGVVTGKVVFTAEAACESKEPCILVTKETTPDDLAGMIAAKGVLTMHGGTTSHAAVVARSMDRVCVVGLGMNLSTFTEGETISIDGSSGNVWKGEVKIISGKNQPVVKELLDLMYKVKQCRVADCEDADLVDLSEVPLDKLHGVVKGLVKVRPEVILDFVPRMDTATESWEGMFGSQDIEQRIVTALWPLDDDQCQKIKVIAPPNVAIYRPVQLIATKVSIEDLVVAKGEFFWGGPQNEAAKKVLNWLRNDGVNPMSVGVVVPGGYASPFQIAQELLK